MSLAWGTLMSASFTKALVVSTCVMLLAPECDADGNSTALSTAVAELNEKLAAYPFDKARTRTRALSEEELPHPVTVEEVVTAIQGWDRGKHPISDHDHRLFQDIAATKTLPPKAKLGFSVAWRHTDPDSKVEARELGVDLSVMTGERTGYDFRIRNQQLDQRPYLELSAGYTWIVAPRPAKPSDGNTGGVVFTIVDDPNHAFHALASTIDDDRVKELEGVVFDSAGNRHELIKNRVGRHENMKMLRFRLDEKPLNGHGIKFFAIEGLTVFGEHQLSRLAVQKAAEQGIDVLPLPILGSQFEFRLTTADGNTIKSSELRGKVVIVDCWASWCGPCIEQFAELKELFAQHNMDGLEIIGVSIDENSRAADEVYKAKKIPWPLVTMPPDENARKLWADAARIDSVPRVLVIDKSGVLRSDDSELPLDLVLSLLEQN